MENKYQTQFPSLMEGKKIMYVHGFGSSAQSGTVKLLRQLMPNAEVVAKDMPIHPEEALALLHRMCEQEHPDLIIGSSMGAMYTEMLYGYDRILVNPAFQMGDTMMKHDMLGKQTFQNPREDGVQDFIVTKSLVKEYKEATEQCFAHVTEEEKKRVYGLFGDKDPLVNTFDLFREHYPQAMRFHGEHQLIDKVAIHYLTPVIRWIDDRQEGRERPIVYITLDALKDGYDKPRASMHKAFEYIIQYYNVYIIAPAPTNDHAQITAAQDWCEEYLSTPAHDHLIFTNALNLVYGDYLITAKAEDKEQFMGTTIEIGSDEFKTWEEIIVFFDRLGGQ